MSKILFKTFKVCLVWALIGAGSVTAYHFLKPYIDRKTPAVTKQAENLKNSAKQLAQKLEMKKLINKMLPSAAPVKETEKQEISEVSEPPTVASNPEPELEPAKSEKITVSNEDDDNELFNRQVAIINDLMQ